MMRLKSKLLSLNANKTAKVKVFSPRNCEELRIPFKADRTAKVVGKLASIQPPQSLHPDQSAAPPLVTGVLVQNDFKLSLMAPEDLREYAGLNTTTITCKQRLTLSAAGVDLVKWALEGTFGNIEELPEMRRGKNGQNNGHGDHMITDGEEMKQEDADEEVASLVAAYLVMGCVSVRYRTNGEVELEWEGNMLNDGIADSIMAVLFSVESSPAAVKRSSAKHSHSHELPDVNPHHSASPEERLERLLWFLEAQFGQDNVAPVTIPKLPAVEDAEEKVKKDEGDDAMKTEEDGEDTQLQERQQKEIDRLHKIGIPVPGVSIKVDRMNATVWLEDLEVESNNKVFADRVRAVVERAVEVTAPLWG
jgi:cleavage and polyadenylation specificity factor subunit 3